jgi:hypothetical protein
MYAHWKYLLRQSFFCEVAKTRVSVNCRIHRTNNQWSLQTSGQMKGTLTLDIVAFFLSTSILNWYFFSVRWRFLNFSFAWSF